MAIPIRIIPEVDVTLTNHVSKDLISLTVANVSSNGGFLDYLIEVTSGVESQVEIGQVFFIVNWNNVLEAIISRLQRQQLVSNGTLESTWSISPTSPAIVTVIVSSSLTPDAGFPRLTYNAHALARQLVTVL